MGVSVLQRVYVTSSFPFTEHVLVSAAILVPVYAYALLCYACICEAGITQFV